MILPASTTPLCLCLLYVCKPSSPRILCKLVRFSDPRCILQQMHACSAIRTKLQPTVYLQLHVCRSFQARVVPPMQAASQSAQQVGLAVASTPAAGGAPLVRHGAAVDAASVAELHQRQAGLSEIVSSLAPVTGSGCEGPGLGEGAGVRDSLLIV